MVGAKILARERQNIFVPYDGQTNNTSVRRRVVNRMEGRTNFHCRKVNRVGYSTSRLLLLLPYPPSTFRQNPIRTIADANLPLHKRRLSGLDNLSKVEYSEEKTTESADVFFAFDL